MFSLSLLVAIAGTAAAQAPRNSGFVGLGFEAAGLDPQHPTAYGFSIQAGFVRQYRRASLRLGATYFQREASEVHQAFGEHVEVSYDFTTTRFRPYVIGGWGLYWLDGQIFVPRPGGYEFRGMQEWSPAMIGGLGFRFRLKTAELFTEVRLHGFTAANWWGSSFAPVTFGVKFD